MTIDTTNATPVGEDITSDKNGGLLKEVLRAAPESETELPLSGDTVTVHYTGTLLDGTKFDSSRDRGEKFSFEVGKGSVIKGWDQGIPTMKRGEQARFTIRSDYGYGDAGSPPSIPAKATLIFDVELFDFHGEDLSDKKDKSLIRRTIRAGKGYTTPNVGARCVVNLKGSDATSGRVFDERQNVEFELGEGERVHIVEGVESALLKFKQDELSRVRISSKSAWGAAGNKEFGVEPHADVTYEIELKSFEKAKESWQLNGKEKLEQSELLKNKGSELFKEAKYASALKKYNKIVEFLATEKFDLEEETVQSKKLLLAANLNIAACSLKTKEFKQVIDSCMKALEMEQNNEKGLFRLAQAYYGLAEFPEAIKYFAKVLEVNPANKDAANQINLSKQKVKEYHEKEKVMYSKMFA